MDILTKFSEWINEKTKSDKDDVSAAANDYLKTLGFVSVAYAWIKVLDVSFKDYNENRNTSDHVSELIDSEISLLIKNAEKNATDIINTNINKLHDLSNALLDHDTIDSNEFNDILENGYNPIEDQKSSPENKNTKQIDTPQD